MTQKIKNSVGFETQLWEVADILRNNVDPSEYKHVVLGLIFLKYISDIFSARQEDIRFAVADENNDEYYVQVEVEGETILMPYFFDRDEYIGYPVFWVPENARWSYLLAHAKQPTIRNIINTAMETIEKENPMLKGALPMIYDMPNLDTSRLGQLVDLISNIDLGSKEAQSKDTCGRVYEYFLARFASSEGKGGGEFYTPSSVVRLLVEMLEPYKGRVYDPCCGSGGMFVQSLKFIQAHNGRRNQVTVYGQESNYTTWRLARMNMAIRGIEAKLGVWAADTFHEDLHPDLRADYILANPPFNICAWGGEELQDDVRWQYGTPPTGNANYAWIQHILHHLAPYGTAGFVLANGSMSTMTGGQGDIRQKLVEADLVDCIVALPAQLFYRTRIPVCLWVLSKNKTPSEMRDRRGQTLFIDARKMGHFEDRTHRLFTTEDITKIADTYRNWKKSDGGYEDEAGFSKSVTLEEIKRNNFMLTPEIYVKKRKFVELKSLNVESLNFLSERINQKVYSETINLGLIGISPKFLASFSSTLFGISSIFYRKKIAFPVITGQVINDPVVKKQFEKMGGSIWFRYTKETTALLIAVFNLDILVVKANYINERFSIDISNPTDDDFHWRWEYASRPDFVIISFSTHTHDHNAWKAFRYDNFFRKNGYQNLGRFELTIKNVNKRRNLYRKLLILEKSGDWSEVPNFDLLSEKQIKEMMSNREFPNNLDSLWEIIAGFFHKDKQFITNKSVILESSSEDIFEVDSFDEANVDEDWDYDETPFKKRFTITLSENLTLPIQSEFNEHYDDNKHTSKIDPTSVENLLEQLEREKEPTEFELETKNKIYELEKKLGLRDNNLQNNFKTHLRDLYKHCWVTGIKSVQVLEAAHIIPHSKCYTDEQSFAKTNGILLASHIHKLYDDYLLGFKPVQETEDASFTYQVVLAPQVLDDSELCRIRDYANKNKLLLRIDNERQINHNAMMARWWLFCKRNNLEV